MIKFFILTVACSFIYILSCQAQSIIAEQDFDANANWSYTSNVTFFSHFDNSGMNSYPDDIGWDSDGFYGIISLTTATQLNYQELSNNVLGAFDLDDEGDFGTSGDAIISFQPIDLTNYNDVTISFDYDVHGFNASTDEFGYEIFEDGVGQGTVILASGISNEGTEDIIISDNVETAYIEIFNDFNGADNYTGFDNVIIRGIRAPSTPTVFFNEFHYDNISTDMNEFIEVAIEESFSGKLDNIQVSLYNGNNGGVYDELTLDQFSQGSTSQGFIFYTWYPVNIQNGAPDGIALNYNDTLVEFLSYEGTFTATDGPAIGMTSIDIGIQESNNTTLSTESLQRIGSCAGDCPNGLSWAGPLAQSPGNSNTSEILPVDWLYFTAHHINNEVAQLNWATMNEVNNSHFVIEYSSNGRQWTDIGKVMADKEKQSINKYLYVDKFATQGMNYYRLRQVDIDGFIEHSKVRKVKITGKSPTPRISLFPNPVSNVLNIRNFLSLGNGFQIDILDVNGCKVMDINQKSAEIPVYHLQTGIYFLSITDESKSYQYRFVKH